MSESILMRLATWATEQPHDLAIRYKQDGIQQEISAGGFSDLGASLIGERSALSFIRMLSIENLSIFSWFVNHRYSEANELTPILKLKRALLIDSNN